MSQERTYQAEGCGCHAGHRLLLYGKVHVLCLECANSPVGRPVVRRWIQWQCWSAGLLVLLGWLFRIAG